MREEGPKKIPDPMIQVGEIEVTLEGKLRESVWPICPICGTNEHTSAGQDQDVPCGECRKLEREKLEIQREGEKLEKRARLIYDPSTDRHLEIPPRYVHCTAETWSGAVPFPLSIWPTEFDFAYIHGPTGSGKTHLATALFRLRWVCIGAGLWTDAAEMVETFRLDIDARESLGQRYVDASLLLLDDLGSERLTDFSADRLNYVLRHRYNWRLPTIVTSNLRPSELAEQDQRLASRLCSDLTVKLRGEDQRLKR